MVRDLNSMPESRPNFPKGRFDSRWLVSNLAELLYDRVATRFSPAIADNPNNLGSMFWRYRALATRSLSKSLVARLERRYSLVK